MTIAYLPNQACPLLDRSSGESHVAAHSGCHGMNDVENTNTRRDCIICILVFNTLMTSNKYTCAVEMYCGSREHDQRAIARFCKGHLW
jgi:hypothetical protein